MQISDHQSGQARPLKTEDPRVSMDMLRIGADQVVQRLRALSASVGPASNASQFYMRMRSKEESSIIKKITTQQRGGYGGSDPNYSFRDVTDYAGVRLVTLYDNQLEQAIRFMTDVVEAGQNIQQPLFDKKNAWAINFQEAYFIPRDYDDPTDIYRQCCEFLRSSVREYYKYDRRVGVRETVKKIQPQERMGSYSAAHILFYAYSYNLENIIEIPLEFQIRTAAEDIWSEINHKRVYKIASDYVWTSKYNMAKITADKTSQDVKDDLNELSRKVEEIARYSRAAERQLVDVWGTANLINPPGNGPTGKISKAVHMSLCLTLYCFISDDIAADDVEQFRKYSNHLGQILQGAGGGLERKTTFDNARKALFKLGESLVSRRDRLERMFKNYESDPEPKVVYPDLNMLETDLEVAEQRILLVELEQLRLAVVLALSVSKSKAVEWVPELFGYRTPVAFDGDKAYIQLLKDIYIRLCEFIDRPSMKVRPICMLFFWKFLVSSRFDKALADRNIRLSYQELLRDKSLPPWSIYHTIVPRVLAYEMFTDVRLLLQRFFPDDLARTTMLGLRNEVKDKLINALILSNESYLSSLHDRSERRGDIHLGLDGREDTIDSMLGVRICSFYHRLFGEHVFEGRGSVREFAYSAAEHLVRNNFMRFDRPEQAETVADLREPLYSRLLLGEMVNYINILRKDK